MDEGRMCWGLGQWRLMLIPSNRSKCKKCHASLMEGETVLRVEVPESDHWGSNWGSYHVRCGVEASRFWRTLKPIRTLADIRIVDADEEELKEVLKELKGVGSPAKKKTEGFSGASDSLKKKEMGKELLEALTEKYKRLTIPQLKEALKLNGMLRSGNKTDLTSRCVEGEGMGVPPMCPTCGKARTRSGKNGKLFCPGYFEDYFRTCGWIGNGTEQREPWKHTDATRDGDEIQQEKEVEIRHKKGEEIKLEKEINLEKKIKVKEESAAQPTKPATKKRTRKPQPTKDTAPRKMPTRASKRLKAA